MYIFQIVSYCSLTKKKMYWRIWIASFKNVIFFSLQLRFEILHIKITLVHLKQTLLKTVTFLHCLDYIILTKAQLSGMGLSGLWLPENIFYFF